MRANDAIAGLMLILAATAMIAYTGTFPAFPGQRYGPSLFPRILGVGLIVCGAILVWNGMAARRVGAPWIGRETWTHDPWRVTSLLLVLAMLLLYILASETVGFIPIAIVFLGCLLLWLGVRPLTAVLVAVVATIAIQWFFGSLLRVPLPRGWLTNFM